MLTVTEHNKRLPEEFRKYFWDVDYDHLILEKYPKFIAERIMNYGDLDSVRWLQSVLDREFIRSVVLNSLNLNPKTRNYWELVLGNSGNMDEGSNEEMRTANDMLADIEDIAAMKLEAIAGRGSKKDFVDMYFILNQFTLEQIFSFHALKYGVGLSNQYHHLKSLVYFNDADEEAMPLITSPLKWDKVKAKIRSCVDKFQP